MKHKISLVLFEQYENLNIYSIVIDDNNDCEMVAFLKHLQSERRNKDAIQIVNLITKIGQNGAQERYFRYEGKMTDNVYALPDHFMVKSDCRLYCLRYSDSLLVLGNGGVKKTKTYQENSHLNNCVITLQKVNKELQKLVKSGDIEITDKTISGKLDFFI